MARPTLTTHRKFRRLARLLGGPAIARGTLELLWDTAYASGEARMGDALDVEEACCWQGERGACVEALVACGFLDADPDGETFEVHDLFDHAPQYVRRRYEREQARKRPVMASQRLATDAPVSSTPAPARAPAPAHAHRTGGTPLGDRRRHTAHACCGRICLPGFLFTEFVSAYGGDEEAARRYVTAFFRAHDPPDDGQPIGDDPVRYWRQTWAAHHPSRAPTAKAVRGSQAEVTFLARTDDTL